MTLSSLLALAGCTVMLEALPAQRETAQALLEQGATYVLAFKGNQGTWYDDVRTLLEDAGLPVQDRRRRSKPTMAASKLAKLIWSRTWLGGRNSRTGRASPVSANARQHAKTKQREAYQPKPAITC